MLLRATVYTNPRESGLRMLGEPLLSAVQHFCVDDTPVLSVYHALACQDAFSISPVLLLKQLLGL